MKGGNSHKFSASRVSLTLIIVIFAIIVICSWEKKPILESFHISSNQFLSIPKDFAGPLINVSYDEERENDEREDFTNSQDCNYGKGKWVPDDKRPLYSGFECKKYLSPMWACKLMQRTDFSFEKFKWQPQNCKMPSFTGQKFLKRMRNKTLAFIGDSLGRQQFQSLMCMITGGKPDNPLVEDVGPLYDLVKKKGAIRPDGWAHRFVEYNATVLFYWSASLCELDPVFVNGSGFDKPAWFKLHLDRPVGFLTTYLQRFDVLVLNTGHHWNRGKFQGNNWELFANNKPVINTTLNNLNNAKKHTLKTLIKYLDSQTLNPNLKVFLRTLSPRHFNNGDWNTGGSCDNLIPLSNGDEVALDASSDFLMGRVVNGSRVRLLDITGLSKLRDEAHISKYSLKGLNGVNDCLHWCLPGIPDTWNEILFAQI